MIKYVYESPRIDDFSGALAVKEYEFELHKKIAPFEKNVYKNEDIEMYRTICELEDDVVRFFECQEDDIRFGSLHLIFLPCNSEDDMHLTPTIVAKKDKRGTTYFFTSEPISFEFLVDVTKNFPLLKKLHD